MLCYRTHNIRKIFAITSNGVESVFPEANVVNFQIYNFYHLLSFSFASFKFAAEKASKREHVFISNLKTTHQR